jgi:hypothetical protein
MKPELIEIVRKLRSYEKQRDEYYYEYLKGLE